MMHIPMTADDDLLFRFRRRGNVWECDALYRRRQARNILAGAVVAAIGCVAVLIILLSALYTARPRLDAQSREFAEASADAIGSGWNEKELFARASPDFLSARSTHFYEYLARLQKLGPGSRRGNCLGSTAISPMSIIFPVTATYACEMDVDSAPAVAVLSLRRDAGAWKITGFYLSTPELR
jgi:hypothetical protein